MEHAVRQTGRLPAGDHRRADRWRLFAGFEHHAVAGEQRRHDMTVRQMAGEIVWTEHGDDAVRLVAQHVATGRGRVPGALRVGAARHFDLADHPRDFCPRFPSLIDRKNIVAGKSWYVRVELM